MAIDSINTTVQTALSAYAAQRGERAPDRQHPAQTPAPPGSDPAQASVQVTLSNQVQGLQAQDPIPQDGQGNAAQGGNTAQQTGHPAAHPQGTGAGPTGQTAADALNAYRTHSAG